MFPVLFKSCYKYLSWVSKGWQMVVKGCRRLSKVVKGRQRLALEIRLSNLTFVQRQLLTFDRTYQPFATFGLSPDMVRTLLEKSSGILLQRWNSWGNKLLGAWDMFGRHVRYIWTNLEAPLKMFRQYAKTTAHTSWCAGDCKHINNIERRRNLLKRHRTT